MENTVVDEDQDSDQTDISDRNGLKQWKGGKMRGKQPSSMTTISKTYDNEDEEETLENDSDEDDDEDEDDEIHTYKSG